jgi:hypothetical protein
MYRLHNEEDKPNFQPKSLRLGYDLNQVKTKKSNVREETNFLRSFFLLKEKEIFVIYKLSNDFGDMIKIISYY